MATEWSGGVRVERCDERVEIWAPRLGVVRGRRVWRVRASGDAANHEWQVVERGEGHPLILELVVSGDGWPRHTARVWEAPPWIGALDERLGRAPDLRRVRSVLLADVVPATRLFDVRDGWEEDGEEERGIDWYACEPDAVSERLTACAGEALDRAARRLGLELDASRMTTLAAARAESVGESNGVAVIGCEHARTVSVVAFAGAPALFVASVTAVDDEAFEEVLAARAPELRLVPFAGAERAAEVLLEQEPGVALPAGEIAAAQEERS
jgi:hypothetical protein